MPKLSIPTVRLWFEWHLVWPPAVSPKPLWLWHDGQKLWNKCCPEKWLWCSPPLPPRTYMRHFILYKPCLLNNNNNNNILWEISGIAQTSPASGRPWLCLQEGGRSWRQPPFLGCNTPQLLHIFPLWNKRSPAGKTQHLGKHATKINGDGFANSTEGFQH